MLKDGGKTGRLSRGMEGEDEKTIEEGRSTRE